MEKLICTTVSREKKTKSSSFTLYVFMHRHVSYKLKIKLIILNIFRKFYLVLIKWMSYGYSLGQNLNQYQQQQQYPQVFLFV